MLDVLDELLNLEGGPLRHLPLQRPNRLDTLAVAEDELDPTTGEQSATDQHEGDEECAPHQAATVSGTRHSLARLALRRGYRGGDVAHSDSFAAISLWAGRYPTPAWPILAPSVQVYPAPGSRGCLETKPVYWPLQLPHCLEPRR